MELIEAVQVRHSVRDFLPTPIPKDTVFKIIEIATRSPSGGNGQPWEIFVASGPVLEGIRKIYQERAANAAPPRPGSSGGPPPAYIMERMATIRYERMKLLGLDPDDPASGRVFMQWGARLFGTPLLIVICMDKVLSNNFDIGMLAQTICLTAQGFGIDSIIAAGLIAHQDVLRAELEIPDELNIITGIGLGYPNPDSIINTYRSPRRPVDEVVRYRE